jgi:hypothetical protein
MKILIDNGVVSSSNFLEADAQEQQITGGRAGSRVTIQGFRRIGIDPNPDQQREKDALFTIGRLAREGNISLYTYSELINERWRGGRGREPLLNALGGCAIHHCPAAIERSRFRQTIEMDDWIRKGGKSDLEKDRRPNDFNQIPYFDWLASLSLEQRDAIVQNAKAFKLDSSDILSFSDLTWFQTLSKALGGAENLPDYFHIWTARRNDIEVFLTIEKKLPRSVQQLKNRRVKAIDLNVAVLRPTQLLELLDMSELDPVPLEAGRFYTYFEIFAMDKKLLSS